MNNENQYCTIYIVRHGETEWNIKKLAQGHTDSPLTEKGIQQAHDLREKFKAIHFDEIFSSDIGRAKNTAEIINQERKLSIKTSKFLRERSFGEYEGTANYMSDLRKVMGEDDNNDGLWTFKFGKGDESEEEVVTRFIRHLREIAAACSNKTVLVVTHGGAMRMFLMRLGFATRKELLGAIGNTAYIKLRSDGIDFFIDETFGITKKSS